MGNNQPTPASPAEPTGAGSFVEGFRVLRVLKNGPGELAGLQPFFDFIVAADGVRLDSEKKDIFVKKIEAAMGHQAGIQLTIYNSREDGLRSTALYPSTTWGGKGKIGISIRHTSIATAGELVWHILEVMPNSPASTAGLRPGSDYIVGSPEEGLTTPDDFYDLVETADKELELYVYNLEDDSARIITIVPNPRWGGAGSLGCTLGFGLLHRIPKKPGSVSSAPTTTTTTATITTITTTASAGHLPTRDCSPSEQPHQQVLSAASHEDKQILLQQQLEAARAKRLAAESEEADLKLKLQQLGPVDDQQEPLPPVEPFPFEPSEYLAPATDEVTTSVDLSSSSSSSSSAVIESTSTDIPLSHDTELESLDPHHHQPREDEEDDDDHHHEQVEEDQQHAHDGHHHQEPPSTAEPAPEQAPAPAVAQPLLPSVSSMPSLPRTSVLPTTPLHSSFSLQSTPSASPATGNSDSPSRLEQGRSNIEQLAQKQRELTEKLRLLREATSKN